MAEPVETQIEETPQTEQEDDSTFVEQIGKQSPEAAQAILKLRAENAAKRIRAQKAEEKALKLEAQLKEFTKKTREYEKALEEKGKVEKEKEMAEAGEIGKISLKFEEQAREFEKLREQLTEKDQLVKELTQRTVVQDRQTFIDRLVMNKGITFASTWEQNGFVAHLLEREDGEFKFNDEEVVVEVLKLKKEKHIAPDTPVGGPQNRGGEAPDSERLKVILGKAGKGILPEKDRLELDAIYGRIEAKT